MRLINADALLERVDKEREYLIARGQTGAEHILVHNFRDLVENAPTITPDKIQAIMSDYLVYRCEPQRPQGVWVVKRLQNGFDDVYCPFCNARPTRSEYGYYLKDNFCHECGADMQKGGTE